MKLAFESIGQGPPLVVLHGLLASAACWRNVAIGLAATHRVLSVDLRNHGRSPRASNMSYVQMADDVLQLIESEALGRPAVLGHSMGGKVAMALALMYPDAVGALAIVDIAPVTYVDRWSHQLQTMRDHLAGATTEGGAAAADVACALGEDTLTHLMIPRMATRSSFVDWRSNLPAIGLSIQELCAFPRQLRYLRSEVALHAIVGARSDYVRPAHADAFAPMFAHVTVDVIPEAGHWVHVDRPEALVRSVRSRLGATRRGGGRATILSRSDETRP